MPNSAKRSRSRFGLRALLIVIPLLGAILGLAPRMWRHYQLERAVKSSVSGGSGQAESLSLLRSLADDGRESPAEMEVVLRSLLQLLESGNPIDTRRTAVVMIRELIDRSGSSKLRKKYLDELVRVVINGGHLFATEEILTTLEDWIPSTGLSREQRAFLLAEAKEVPPGRRPGWIRVLGAIGGRKETQMILRWVNATEDDASLGTAVNDALVRSTWPDLLPYVDQHLEFPELAAFLLDFRVLQRVAGREILLEYAADESKPTVLRQKAVDQLTSTVVGIEYLLAGCDDDAVEATLSKLLGSDIRQILTQALAQAKRHYGNEFWDELIAETNVSKQRNDQGGSESAASKQWREQQSEVAGTALRLLSGTSDPITPDEWRKWLEDNQPGIISQRRILEVCLQRPNLLYSGAILRRIVPYSLGYIPEDCRPLYKQMLNSQNAALQYWACHALLNYSDDTDAVPIAIRLIGESSVPDHALNRPGMILLLQERFAVNFFWDVPAWTSWWEQHESRLDSSTGSRPAVPSNP